MSGLTARPNRVTSIHTTEKAMYTLKTWNSLEWGHPEVRMGMPYGLAWAIATKAGYAKAQIICEDTDIIELETKALDNSTQLRYNVNTQRRE